MNKIKAIIAPVVEELGKFAETAVSQTIDTKKPQGEVQKQTQPQSPSDESANKQFVEDLYKKGPGSENVKPEDIARKNEQDKKELEKKRLEMSLHQKYYQNLVNRPRPPEEREAEKIEREEKEDRWEFQKKEEKKKPITVDRAQNIEKHRGSSG